MSTQQENKPESRQEQLLNGAKTWRGRHCPVDVFDVFTALQFINLVKAGLRENHKLLELNCDCLGLARLAIPYLDEDRYVGVESEQAQVMSGVIHELGAEVLTRKLPKFIYSLDKYTKSLRPAEIFDVVAVFNLVPNCSTEMLQHHLSQLTHFMDKDSVLVGLYYESFYKDDPRAYSDSKHYYYSEKSIHQTMRKFGLAFMPLDVFYSVPVDECGVGRFFKAVSQ